MSMRGKVAVVAAGGSGIGRMTALGLAERGARVAVIDLDKAAAEAVAAQIGGQATAHVADCGVVSDLTRVVAEISSLVDHVDILFNNVGMPNPHGIMDITEEQWQRSVDVNLKSGFFLTQLLLPLIRKSGRGGSFQALKHRCADLAVGLTTAQELVFAAAETADTGDAAALALFAPLALARAGEALKRTSEEGIQLHGGVGFTDEFDIGRYYKRALADLEILSGPVTAYARMDAVRRGWPA